MLASFRARLTYANVVASLALFVALGGISFAAVTLPRNSVGTSQLKSNAVTGAKVKNSSLTGRDIKDRSLTPADFSGSVQGPAGPAGAAGAPGPAGAPGSAGAPGLSGYEVVSETFAEVFAPDSNPNRGLSEFKSVACPAGKRAIAGGADLGTDSGQGGFQRVMSVSASVPTADGAGWQVQLFNNGPFGASIDLKVTAVCATVAP
jgi:hypothetical protein